MLASWWTHSFWFLHFLFLLCQLQTRSALPFQLVWLLLLLYIHYNLSAHLLSFLLCLTAIVFCFWVPCETALLYCLDLLRLPILICLLYVIQSAYVRLLFLRLPILSLSNILCLSLPVWDFFYTWHHVVYLDFLKITLMYACICMCNCYLQ